MLTIHIVQARLGYGIDYIKFADQEGLVLYLLTRGVTDDNILKALDALERHGAYTIQQASRTPGAAGVVEDCGEATASFRSHPRCRQ